MCSHAYGATRDSVYFRGKVTELVQRTPRPIEKKRKKCGAFSQAEKACSLEEGEELSHELRLQRTAPHAKLHTPRMLYTSAGFERIRYGTEKLRRPCTGLAPNPALEAKTGSGPDA